MRRSYDPRYGSREQLRDSAEHGMKLARERDALKTENAELKERIAELETIIKYNLKTQEQISELEALVKYITEGE